MRKEIIRKTAAYLSLLAVMAFIITGYGITYYQIVEKLTFGLLNKALSFKIHSVLIWFLLLFLAVHLFFSCDMLKKRDGR